MSEETAGLLDHYFDFLKKEITCQYLEGVGIYEITTPFLDRHNDYIQIYVYPNEQGFRLTDEGYTVDDLHMSWLVWDETRQDSLHKIAQGFGVMLVDDRLETTSSKDNFGLEMHSLLQAMQAAYGMVS